MKLSNDDVSSSFQYDICEDGNRVILGQDLASYAELVLQYDFCDFLGQNLVSPK